MGETNSGKKKKKKTIPEEHQQIAEFHVSVFPKDLTSGGMRLTKNESFHLKEMFLSSMLQRKASQSFETLLFQHVTILSIKTADISA